ncbi:MAG: histidinol-phosphate transaminase [Myxococcota bacterium]
MSDARRPEPIPPLATLPAYKVPHAAAPIDLWLHGNEGAPPPLALLESLRDVELVRRYPSSAALEAQLGERLGVPATHVCVTAGADDALDRVFRSYLAGGWGPREVVLPLPTFVMLPHYAKVCGAAVRTAEWPAEAFPEAEVMQLLGPDTRAVALVTPNNPTGAAIPVATIERIARAAPQALMLVDLAYGEMADQDVTKSALALPNALVFRTFSKAWGLAGARVGYVIGAPELLAPLRAVAPPFAVPGPSLWLAAERLRTGEADMLAYVAQVRRERGQLTKSLAALGAKPVESQANFVFARVGSKARAMWLRDGLAGLGIGIRAFTTEAEIADGVRITCPGNDADLARLQRGLAAVLQPELKVAAGTDIEGLRGKPAWVFGRTPDEMRRARIAGAVPIGLGDPDGADAKDLIAAGAARVVASADALAEVMA